MNKQEFSATSLTSGLKYKSKVTDKVYDLISVSNTNHTLVRIWDRVTRDFPVSLSHVIPIIRPISDMTKPCIQSNYNEGLPFVPIVELAKMSSFFKTFILVGVNSKKDVFTVKYKVSEKLDTTTAFSYNDKKKLLGCLF